MRIYLDNHSSSKPSSSLIKKMIPYLQQHFALLTAPYLLAEEQFPAVEEAYTSLYRLIGASEEDTILVCSSSAEAINHIFFSTYLDFTRQTGKNHFITTQVDEAAIILGMSRLESLGISTKLCTVNSNGLLTPESLIEAISPRSALLSLSYANGLTGVIHPVEEIAKICKERDILLHLDVTHILGKLSFDVKDVNPDFITFNGDSLHVPRGSGALYMKNPYKLSPFIVGGIEQAGLRGGSVNVAALVGLGHAGNELLEYRDLMCTEIARLRDQLEERLQELIPESIILFKNVLRLPNCSAIAFPGIHNEALLYFLNKKGVYASIGGGHFQSLSNILKACGFDAELAHSAISFSLSRDTTEEEIEVAVERITESVQELLKISKHIL